MSDEFAVQDSTQAYSAPAFQEDVASCHLLRLVCSPALLSNKATLLSAAGLHAKQPVRHKYIE